MNADIEKQRRDLALLRVVARCESDPERRRSLFEMVHMAAGQLASNQSRLNEAAHS